MTDFKMKYTVTPRYLTGPSKRRPSDPIRSVRFMVAHDTGNPGSTAAGNVSYYEQSRNEMYASAHLFVDDTDIIECIPFLTGDPEKAWHVVYNTPIDNDMFGVDSNDCAGGVELCFGGKIDAAEAYKRYIWTLAYACFRYSIDPSTHITGHYILDPTRKVDPKFSLAAICKTFDDLIADVVAEYRECTVKEDDYMLPVWIKDTIINTWITPAWTKANETADQKTKDNMHLLANELRKAAGCPEE